ncbi:MAG TPA: DNA-directed RNA polymerase subunit alpha C-terminal domain-containing protein [Chryseobacterium sp.]
MINLVIMARCLKPVYTENHVLENKFLQGIIANPARRTLEKEKIDSLGKLSDYSENELMKFHGFGKNTILKLKNYMEQNNFSLKS